MSPITNFSLEFTFKASPRLLYTLISSAEGLSRWFAERVSVDKDIYTFEWEGSVQKARLKEFKENDYVVFEWLDDFHEGYSLEMRIDQESVSGELALHISDYAEDTDTDFTKRWWETQLKKLSRAFN